MASRIDPDQRDQIRPSGLFANLRGGGVLLENDKHDEIPHLFSVEFLTAWSLIAGAGLLFKIACRMGSV